MMTPSKRTAKGRRGTADVAPSSPSGPDNAPPLRTFGKLIIQIPCYNEAATLGVTLDSLPRTLPGFRKVEWLIIDDGSVDDTVAVAKQHGVDHIVRLTRNRGLARAFTVGLEACVRAGADVIVNTDADNQYCADDIARLVEPILQGRAEFVVGARPIADVAHFSRAKKLLQRVGSLVVRIASRTDVPDAPSGFRAFTREAAMQINVFGEYTYTLETIIQAGQKRMAVTSVSIRVNEDLRPSRLVRSVPNYVFRSAATIIRIFATYKPLRFFIAIAAVVFTLGLLLGLRYLYFVLTGSGAGHIQSVIFSASLMGTGVFIALIGIIADLIAVNRKLLEKIDARLSAMLCGVLDNPQPGDGNGTSEATPETHPRSSAA
jgi:glycosyltransferase involved in cell wall biosynthesis